jgi:uncharacterized protein (DUF697 family)
MKRKPLPKAITRPIAELHAITGGTGPSTIASAGARAVPATAFDEVEAEPALGVSSAPIANDTAPRPLSAEARAAAEKRHALARKIVDRHRNYAALGGLVPVPVANIASVTAINLRMVRQLSALYQVPFQRERTRSFLVGLVGGAVPTGVGAATSSVLMWIVPGGLLVGLGASAVTAGALTHGIGQVFIESFENNART